MMVLNGSGSLLERCRQNSSVKTEKDKGGTGEEIKRGRHPGLTEEDGRMDDTKKKRVTDSRIVVGPCKNIAYGAQQGNN